MSTDWRAIIYGATCDTFPEWCTRAAERVERASEDASTEIEGKLERDLAAAQERIARYEAALRRLVAYTVGDNHVDAVLAGREHKKHDGVTCALCEARAALTAPKEPT